MIDSRGGEFGRGGGMRMDPARAACLFGAARVVRLATVNSGGAPHVVPVTAAVVGADIVFAVDHKPKSTTALRRLANIATEPRVSFLADQYDEDWARLWWVRADAVAQILTGTAEITAALDALAAKYQQYQMVRPGGPVVAARVTRWSGWSASDA